MTLLVGSLMITSLPQWYPRFQKLITLVSVTYLALRALHANHSHEKLMIKFQFYNLLLEVCVIKDSVLL